MLLAYLYLALLEPKTPPKQLRRPCRELLPKRSRKEVEKRAQMVLLESWGRGRELRLSRGSQGVGWGSK